MRTAAWLCATLLAGLSSAVSAKEPAPPPAVSSASVVAASTAAARTLSTTDLRRAVMLTDLLIDTDRLEEAEQFARARLADQEEKTAWLLRLARIASLQGRASEAAAIYRDLVARQGESAALLLQLGTHALAAGETDTARAALERARTLDPGPRPPYYLSELAFSQGRDGAGRSWAKEALSKFPKSPAPDLVRMRLRLRSRLGWDDSLHEDFGQLFDGSPKDSDTLFEWTDSLLRAGLEREAGEPLALLHERFPNLELRTRRFEAERLRRLGPAPAHVAYLEDSVRRWPDENGFHFSLGEQYLRSRRWRAAERELSLAHRTPAYRVPAEDMSLELHRSYDHFAGPYFRWHGSANGRTFEEGLTYQGYASDHVRLDGQAGVLSLRVPSRDYSRTMESLQGGAAWESTHWTAGGNLTATSGAGLSGVSPGVSGRWDPKDGWAVAGDASFRRPWTDAPDTAAAGARSDQLGVSCDALPLPRLYAGAQGRLYFHRLNGGSRARQSLLAPQLAYRLFDRPFYLSAGYRFVAEDAWGEDAFFSRLGLTRRTRTHYATVAAGRRWLRGRLRTDAHAFNGADPGRGRSFGSFDLVGAGAAVEWFGPVLRAAGGYDFTRDSQAGIAGYSHTLSLTLQWHWWGHGR